jgi:hypothetical protein
MKNIPPILFFMLLPLFMGGIMGLVHKISPWNKKKVSAIFGILLSVYLTYHVTERALNYDKAEDLRPAYSGIITKLSESDEYTIDLDGYAWDTKFYTYDIQDFTGNIKSFKTDYNDDVLTSHIFRTGDQVFIYRLNYKEYISINYLSLEQRKQLVKSKSNRNIYYWNYLWIAILLAVCIPRIN